MIIVIFIAGSGVLNREESRGKEVTFLCTLWGDHTFHCFPCPNYVWRNEGLSLLGVPLGIAENKVTVDRNTLWTVKAVLVILQEIVWSWVSKNLKP